MVVLYYLLFSAAAKEKPRQIFTATKNNLHVSRIYILRIYYIFLLHEFNFVLVSMLHQLLRASPIFLYR